MKNIFKSILSAIALFGIIATAAPAAAEPAKLGQGFVIIGDPDSVISLISTATEKNGTTVQNWLFNGVPLQNYIANSLVEYDCARNTVRLIRFESYDYNGDLQGTTYPKEGAQPIVAGSRYEVAKKLACGEATVASYGFKSVLAADFAKLILLHRQWVFQKTS